MKPLPQARWLGLRLASASVSCTLFLSLLLPGSQLQAAPFARNITFTQPSGDAITLWGRGDEFSAVFETLDGFTVVFDEAQLAYCYGHLSPDGAKLLSTGTQVQSATGAALGLTPHLRVSAAALQQQISARFSRWDQVMHTTERWEALKSRSRLLPGKNSPPTTTTVGNKMGLCLLIQFTDDPAKIPQATLEEFCNGDNFSQFGNNGSVKKYFEDISNGLLTYSNVVTIYITAPKPKTYYNDTTKDAGAQANILIKDVLDTLKAMTNYTTQILPAFAGLTVDSSSQVVACNVFYTGGNGGRWTYGLWPHSWGLYNAGAQELSPGGKKVFLYQITDMGSQLTIGTFCHENGHMLCDFPDLYDYNYVSSGVGDWCLMASGNYGGNGGNPVAACAYLRRAAGWATTTDLNATSSLGVTVSGVPGADFNHFYRYAKPSDVTEYFLMECRFAGGRDGAVPGTGVAVWHIDEKGSNSKVNLQTNATHNNYEATLVQADNLWDMENNRNDGNAADVFYLGNPASGYANQLSDFTKPAAKWWNGTPSGMVLRDFSASSNTMTFIVGTAPSLPVINTQPQSQTVGIGQNATFSVVATGATPLSYQWRFNGSAIASATGSTYVHVSVQTNDAGAYSVVVSNALGTATSSNAMLTVANGAPGVIAQWNFNSRVADTTATTGTTAPAFGGGNASLIGGATASYATGSASDTASSDNSGWNVTTFPSQGTGNKTVGAQFRISTSGQENIVIRWDQRVSNSASKYSRLQYSTNGTAFTDFPTSIAMTAANVFEAKASDLSGIAGVRDNPLFAFRLVSEWQSTALGSGSAQYVTASSSGYGTGGTIRLDMVTVSGTSISLPDPVQLAAPSTDSSGRFQFQVTGSAGSHCAIEASPNLTTWTRLVTNTLPFVFTDTTAPRPTQRFYRATQVP